MDSSAYTAGVAIGASLIIAIGAQNALVLKQGLKREHVLAVCTVCVAVDWTLITMGAGGFGTLIAMFPSVTAIAAWAGAAFLGVYGALSFRSALRPRALSAEESSAAPGATLRGALLTTLAVSLLNPHVYLDTVVLLGSIAAQYGPGARVWFVLGACTASAVWFYGLGYGARLLAPLFARKTAWRVLDAAIGIVMWSIAYSLLRGVL